MSSLRLHFTSLTRSFLFIVAGWMLLLFALNVQTVYSQNRKFNILYVNSYNLGYSWSDSILKGVLSALNRDDVNTYIENLDAKRFGQEKFGAFAGYYTKKYVNIPFDAIVVSDNDALDFAIQYGDSLFPHIPVVFCGINNPLDYNFENTRIYGYTESTDIKKAISVIIKLLPHSKSLLILSDNTTSGEIVKKEFNNIEKLFPFIKISFIDEIDMEETLGEIKKGNQADIIYALRVNRDKYGNNVDYLDFFRKLAVLSPKPVFADDESIIGQGVVGGNANRGFTQGNKAGLLALQLIKETNPKRYPHVNTVQEEYIFDHEQLNKFNINYYNLPENSVVINKPIEKYFRYILSLTLIIIMLTCIVILLTINIRKRARAEQKVSDQLVEINERNILLEDSYQQLSNLNCELEESNDQLININVSLDEAKKKAEESEKLKTSFLANLSHEIRTPLNAILGFSSLLREVSLNEHERENYFNIIQSNSDSLLVLIDDILDYSRLDADQMQICPEQVEVNDVFEEIAHFFNQRQPENKVQLKISDPMPEKRITLLTDKKRFKQILNNLLTNAFKFTEKGFVEIGYHLERPGEITFFVKDSGIGIDKKYHEAIFERFRKLNGEKGSFYSGSGLGLAICRKLTDLMGGRIWVEGEPGKGSTFYFTLPDYTMQSR